MSSRYARAASSARSSASSTSVPKTSATTSTTRDLGLDTAKDDHGAELEIMLGGSVQVRVRVAAQADECR